MFEDYPTGEPEQKSEGVMHVAPFAFSIAPKKRGQRYI